MAEERQNKWLLQKQHFCCSPPMSKEKVSFQRKGSDIISNFHYIF